MIRVTRLDGTPLVVNGEHIATLEATPDTILALANGVRLVVREALPVVVGRFIAYRRRVLRGLGRRAALAPVLPLAAGEPGREE